MQGRLSAVTVARHLYSIQVALECRPWKIELILHHDAYLRLFAACSISETSSAARVTCC